ncbi:MAG: hypothetical protein HQL54_08865 [Magnetococcales bacterium]|nr:hypothetical protein [Magnetococcales bacterium]
MSKEELVQQVTQAIEEAENWAKKGWSMTFGFRNDAFNSMEEYEKSASNMVHREEAKAFWDIVERTGQESAVQGRSALDALAKDDVLGASRLVYFAMFKEKQLLERTTTWGPVFKALQAAAK